MRRFLRNLVAVSIFGFNVAEGQIIENGSFESATVDPGDRWVGLRSGSKVINGWIVASGTIDYVGRWWGASEGIRSIDLNGNSPGSISQSFRTTIDSVYQILFAMAGNVDSGPPVKNLVVSIGDISQQFSFNTTGYSRKKMGWTQVGLQFTAVDSLTTVTFASSVSGAYGPAIDNVRVDAQTAVREIASKGPLSFELRQNYPNPFNPSTTIEYQVSQLAPIKLQIFNLLGQEVRTLVEERQPEGTYRVEWDGLGDTHQKVPSGAYLYRIIVGDYAKSKKMVLLR